MRVKRCVTASTGGRALLVALISALFVPAVAAAHIERASYWPDPAPDCSITPCAGGEVPTPRSLASALETGGAGVTRVVCQRELDEAAERVHQGRAGGPATSCARHSRS